MTIFRKLYGETGESSIIFYQDNELYFKILSVSIFIIGYNEHFSFLQTIISSNNIEEDQEKMFSIRQTRDTL
jgi:hypothetical protein